MILRLLRAVNRVYPFVVLFGYMGAFLLAFICIFSFPLGALVLVIGSVLSLAFVVFFGETLGGMERILPRPINAWVVEFVLTWMAHNFRKMPKK